MISPRFLTTLLTSLLGLVGLLQSSASAADGRVKNVLFIVADDLKASVLGCYRDPICKTPNLDRLARKATVFERAYCQGTSCMPSRVSFMFGRYKDSKGITLGEHLQRHDFYTARVGKIFHMRVPGDIIAGIDGVDFPACWTQRFNSPGPEAHTPGEYACLNLNIVTRDLDGRESTRMKNRMFVSVKGDNDGSEQADFKTADKAIELLSQPSDRPFFLAVGMVRPHYPMVAPEADFAPYTIDRIKMPENWHDDTSDIPVSGIPGITNAKNPIGKYPDNQKRMWAAYYASVAFMDRQVGRVLAALENSHHRDNTAVIFTSDHGYHLGEHGFWQKSNLHEQVIRVPLLIHAPGMNPDRSRSLVELVDLYPTVCELTGVPVPEHSQGKSLVPVLRNASAEVKPEALSFQKGTSIRMDRWHYIRYDKGGAEELYDMDADPDQLSNLASDDQHSDEIKSFRSRFKTIHEQLKD